MFRNSSITITAESGGGGGSREENSPVFSRVAAAGGQSGDLEGLALHRDRDRGRPRSAMSFDAGYVNRRNVSQPPDKEAERNARG